jgi:hypothetical protein
MSDPQRRAFDVRARPIEARIDAHAPAHDLLEARKASPSALGIGPARNLADLPLSG